MLKRHVTAIVAGALLTAGPALAAGGWAVRICRGATDASAIKISVGKPGGQDQVLVNWQSDAKELDFPIADAMVTAGRKLHVTADSEPADGKVAMCVLHDGKAVKAMNFKDLLAVTASRTGHDSKCKCPKSGAQ